MSWSRSRAYSLGLQNMTCFKTWLVTYLHPHYDSCVVWYVHRLAQIRKLILITWHSLGPYDNCLGLGPEGHCHDRGIPDYSLSLDLGHLSCPGLMNTVLAPSLPTAIVHSPQHNKKA